MASIDIQLIRDTLISALREDIGSGDITTRATVAADAVGTARIAAKQALTVSGIPVAAEVMRLMDPGVRFIAAVKDGASVTPGAVLADIHGQARALLTAERTTL